MRAWQPATRAALRDELLAGTHRASLLPGPVAQVRQVVLPAGEASGPCKARALAQQLWEGEEFHLQASGRGSCPTACSRHRCRPGPGA